MSERLKKINDLIRDETSRVILAEMEFGRGVIVTVTRAETSPTLEHSTVSISIFPEKESEKTLVQINKKIYAIQQSLNKRLIMRPVPKIRFKIDQSGQYAEKIEKIINNVI
ncbi:MAG: 30S ribosome-binding factor RbfA [Candidatus Yanofskybacteria bacterium]|nr:30S ribosome-binding factor RbfA [Candidatus Yanofskybacteria bacterium]